MNLDEAKEKFVQSWGTLASQWGINRTMAQIHSLLLVTANPISAEEVMEALNISRGNANMNLRALIDWGLVRKEHKSGERKEFFVAEKDIWEVARKVVAERKKREWEPVLRVLDEVEQVENPGREEEVEAFKDTISNLKKFAVEIDNLTNKFIKADRHWFFGSVMKLIK